MEVRGVCAPLSCACLQAISSWEECRHLTPTHACFCGKLHSPQKSTNKCGASVCLRLLCGTVCVCVSLRPCGCVIVCAPFRSWVCVRMRVCVACAFYPATTALTNIKLFLTASVAYGRLSMGRCLTNGWVACASEDPPGQQSCHEACLCKSPSSAPR